MNVTELLTFPVFIEEMRGLSPTVVRCEASMLINKLNYILLSQYKLSLPEYHINNTKSVKM